MTPFAEYPRPDGPHAGGEPGVRFEALGEAWALVTKELGTWVAATVVLFAALYGALRVAFPLAGLLSFGDGLGRILPSLLAAVALLCLPVALAQVVAVGMVALGVRQSRGEYVNVAMVFEPFRRFGPTFLTALLHTALVAASLLLGFLPALFVVPVLALMPAVAYLRELGPLEALSTTFAACWRHWLSLFALLFVTSLLAGVGVFACVVGLFVTLPLYFAVLALHYRAFFEAPPAPR